MKLRKEEVQIEEQNLKLFQKVKKKKNGECRNIDQGRGSYQRARL
jgi:hypothetical protein